MAVRPVKAIDLKAFWRDLRASSADAAAALVLTGGLFVWFYQRVQSGASPTVEVMPYLADGAGRYWMYWLCQAFGWSALLWAWITIMLGLIRSSRVRFEISPRSIEKLHRTTSLTTIWLMFGHAFWFFAEEFRANSDNLSWPGRTWLAFANAFVPGAYPSGTGVIAILIGLLAFYLAIPLGLLYYFRRAIGPRSWRVLHASIIVVYVLSVWHTLLYGTNVWFDSWFRTTLWLLQLPVAALLLVRLLAPAHRAGQAGLDSAGRWIARIAVVVTMLVVLAVVITGRDGGRTHGVAGSGLNVTATMVWIGLGGFAAGLALAVFRALRGSARRQSSATDSALSTL